MEIIPLLLLVLVCCALLFGYPVAFTLSGGCRRVAQSSRYCRTAGLAVVGGSSALIRVRRSQHDGVAAFAAFPAKNLRARATVGDVRLWEAEAGAA